MSSTSDAENNEQELTIRATEPGDYEAFWRIFSGQKVVRGTLQLPYPTVEMWRQRLADPPAGMVRLVACRGNDAVGQLDIHTFYEKPRRRHVGVIGMAVRDDCQGQGVGFALMQAAIDIAGNWLNLTRLELDVFVDNASAVALYKKCGFKIEGTRVGYAFREGRYADVHCMARLTDSAQMK